MPATIERKRGGKFTACGEHLSGTTVEIAPPHRIVQKWRAYQWPAEYYSELSLTLQLILSGQGTQLSLVQTGVPAEHYRMEP